MKSIKDASGWILIILLAGCFTSKKADKDLIKIQGKYPEKIAEFARTKYPCDATDSSVQIITQDSLVYIDCPDYTPPSNDYGTDTVFIKVPGKPTTVKVPVHVPIYYITKTITIVDKADSLHYLKLHQEELSKIGNLEKSNGHLKTWRWVLGSIAFLLFLLLAIIIYSVTKRA